MNATVASVKSCQRVEITARGRGPVVRGEACADSFYAALESAVVKLGQPAAPRQGPAQGPLRRHRGRFPWPRPPRALPVPEQAFNHEATEPHEHEAVFLDQDHAPGRVVRTKEHEAKPMSVDDALYEMELVGHNFFLFYDKQTERPSVVYRRHAYDYGLIRLS